MSRKPKTPPQTMVPFGSPAEASSVAWTGQAASVPTGNEVAEPASRQATTERSAGRPRIHKEGSRPVSIVLRPCDERAIAELLQVIEDATGAHLSVSELVRGCIQGVRASSLNLGLAATERQLAELIARQIDANTG